MGDANNLEHNLKRTEPNQQIQCTSAVYHALHSCHQQNGVKLRRARVKARRFMSVVSRIGGAGRGKEYGGIPLREREIKLSQPDSLWASVASLKKKKGGGGWVAPQG